MIWSYAIRAGRVVKTLVAGGAATRHPRGEDPPDRHFSQTLLRNYYRQELEHGSRFKSGFSKNQIKRVHETTLECFDQTGREHRP